MGHPKRRKQLSGVFDQTRRSFGQPRPARNMSRESKCNPTQPVSPSERFGKKGTALGHIANLSRRQP